MGIIAEIHRDLDRGALQLMAEYRGRLFGEAINLCADKALAEDLVFRTLERALDRVDTYKEDNNLFAWMKSIMENIHKDDMKRPVPRGTAAVESDELERHAGADNSTDEQILRNSDEEAVRKALRHIDPEFRQLVLMRYYEELSLKEIAGFLNKPVCTVSRRIQIALRLLAGKLEAEFGKAKKPLAILLAALLGVGTLFGAWVSPLGDWVAEKVFGSAPAEEERVQLNGIQTFAEPVCTEQMVGNVATASVVPQSAATKISNVQNTTKQESEQNMNIGSMIKSTVAATTVAAMGFAAQGEVKVVRVVPNGEAGENPDGASWATAYGDIKTAYESLGADGGEVWIKKGLYVMSNAVEMAANIGVYGGFAGTETSRAAADPKNNTTLLTGDQELNDKLMTGSFRAWRYNTIVPAWDYETLTFNAQTPSFTADSRCNYYAWSAWPQYICDSTTPKMTSDDKSNQKVFDTLADTACAFYRTAETPSVGTVAFEGLVFSGFKTNVFNVAGSTGGETPDASHLVVRNCRFLACCNGLAGRGSSLFRPLYVRNMKTTVSGCEFSHCVNGINFAAPGLLTDETALVVSNCLFRYAFISDSGSVAISNANHPTPDASPKVHVADCTFTGNFNPAGDCCGVSVLANGLVERCTFTQNYGYEYPVKTLCIYGMDPNDGGGSPRLEVRDCRFVGNEIRNERGSNSTTAIMTGTASNFKTSSSGYPIVRNCYFADNKIVRYRVRKSYPNGVCYYQSGKCSLIFINCAAENNSIYRFGRRGYG